MTAEPRWWRGTLRSDARRLTGHNGSVRAVVSVLIDGEPVIISGGADGSVRLWDARTGTQRGDTLTVLAPVLVSDAIRMAWWSRRIAVFWRSICRGRPPDRTAPASRARFVTSYSRLPSTMRSIRGVASGGTWFLRIARPAGAASRTAGGPGRYEKSTLRPPKKSGVPLPAWPLLLLLVSKGSSVAGVGPFPIDRRVRSGLSMGEESVEFPVIHEVSVDLHCRRGA